MQAAVLSNLIADSNGGDPRQQFHQAARRGAIAGPGPGPSSGETTALAANIIHTQAPTAAPHHPPSPPALQPDGSGELGFLQRLADGGGDEGRLLVALTRRCDALEAQNAVLRTKVLQLYPPGVCMHACM